MVKSNKKKIWCGLCHITDNIQLWNTIRLDCHWVHNIQWGIMMGDTLQATIHDTIDTMVGSFRLDCRLWLHSKRWNQYYGGGSSASKAVNTIGMYKVHLTLVRVNSNCTIHFKVVESWAEMM